MYTDEERKQSIIDRQNRVRGVFYRYKEENPCVDCGGYFPSCAMQFDHVRGEKKFGLAQRSASFGSKKFAEEMAKCDLVCSNCHAIRTHTNVGVALTAKASG